MDMLVYFFLGVIVGGIVFVLIFLLVIFMTCKPIGTLVVDQTDPEVDRYSFEIEKDLSELPNHELVMMKVKNAKGKTTPR